MELAPIIAIAEKFVIEGTVNHLIPINTGHIHHSYQVQTTKATYFLQQINHRVFPDVQGMMRNIAQVTKTLKAAFESTQYETIAIIPTCAGDDFLTVRGDYWRMYVFLRNRISHDIAPNLEIVKESAEAFVAFTRGLHPLSSNELTITIPKFHSMKYRLEQLAAAIAKRRLQAGVESDSYSIIALYSPKLILLEKAWEDGILPSRIIHNDTKLNNVLFDTQGRARCIVDLDTVMPGIIHFDIGDALRTMSSTAMEDEENPDLVTIEKTYYQKFQQAYKKAASDFLTAEEIQWMPYAAPYMAMIMAIRFFTDHLNGNVYFHSQYPTHNLVRARNQLLLTQQFLNIEKLD